MSKELVATLTIVTNVMDVAQILTCLIDLCCPFVRKEVVRLTVLSVGSCGLEVPTVTILFVVATFIE